MKTQFRCLEDYQVGQKGVTLTRTVTGADITNFACLTADYNRAHMDRHYGAKSIYGDRIAHGMLGASLINGMLSLTAPHTIGRGVPGAYLWSFDVNYRGAVKMGDTIKIQWTIAEKGDDPAHEGFGVVKVAIKVVNQDEALLYDGTLDTLVRKKSAGDAVLKLKPGKPWDVDEFVYDPKKVYGVEDYPVGSGGDSDGRTITEADVVAYAGLTGDYDPQCVDAEYARKSQFGGRIAHGILVFGDAFGLWNNKWDGYRHTRFVLGGHLEDGAVFLAPVKIGDTIRCRYKVIENRISKSKPEAGIIRNGLQVLNQRNEVVQEGWVVLMRPSRAGLSMPNKAYPISVHNLSE